MRVRRERRETASRRWVLRTIELFSMPSASDSSPSDSGSGSRSEGGRSSRPFWLRPISYSKLAQLLRRLGNSYQAGVDLRKLWSQEAQFGSPSHRYYCDHVRKQLDAGESLADAVRKCDGYFPPLACEMIEVGEASGKLETVLFELADHYDQLVTLRRSFLIGIAWPAIQLVMAVMVVGLLIWIFGIISNRGGETIDPLGFGLVGDRGLAIYFGLILTLAGLGAFLVMALKQQWFGPVPMQMLMRAPVIGKCIQTNALARIAWTLRLTLESGVDARRSLRMAIRSSQLAYYIEKETVADRVVERGGEFYEALRETGRFPDEFLQAVSVAEHSGTMADSLAALSQDLASRAKIANRVLMVAATFVIWGAIAALVIFLIFRLFFFYLGIIEDALKPL